MAVVTNCREPGGWNNTNVSPYGLEAGSLQSAASGYGQGVDKAGSFWGLQGKIRVLAFPGIWMEIGAV